MYVHVELSHDDFCVFFSSLVVCISISFDIIVCDLWINGKTARDRVSFFCFTQFQLQRIILILSFLLSPPWLASFVLYHSAAHDCCEVVSVTLCALSRNVPGDPEDQKSSLGRVALLAEHRFSFVQDLAFDMAQFLVSKTTVGEMFGICTTLLHDSEEK